MKVEVIPMVLVTRFRHGKKDYAIEQPYDQARVFVDGVQVGLTMTDPEDANYRILHPLSRGYPRQWLNEIVKNSDGQLTGTMNSPVPFVDEEDEEEFDEDDE